MNDKELFAIEDEVTRMEKLMVACLELEPLPISRYMPDIMNGYLDFYERDPELKWEDGSPITDFDVLQHLMVCKTDEEVWSFMGKGIGNIQDLYAWYKGAKIDPILEGATGIPCYCEKDEDKAEKMLVYFLNLPDVAYKVRKEAESILKMSKVVGKKKRE